MNISHNTHVVQLHSPALRSLSLRFCESLPALLMLQARVYTVCSASILNTPFNVTNTLLLLRFFRVFQVFIQNRATAVCHYINSMQSVCQRELSVPLLTSGGGHHLHNSDTSTIDEARPNVTCLPAQSLQGSTLKTLTNGDCYVVYLQ